MLIIILIGRCTFSCLLYLQLTHFFISLHIAMWLWCYHIFCMSCFLCGWLESDLTAFFFSVSLFRYPSCLYSAKPLGKYLYSLTNKWQKQKPGHPTSQVPGGQLLSVNTWTAGESYGWHFLSAQLSTLTTLKGGFAVPLNSKPCQHIFTQYFTHGFLHSPHITVLLLGKP